MASKPLLKNPKPRQRKALGSKSGGKFKRKKTTKSGGKGLGEQERRNAAVNRDVEENRGDELVDDDKKAPQRAPALASEQLRFFLDRFQSANGVQLSSLELESIKESCILESPKDAEQDVKCLEKQLKLACGPSWKEILCEGQILEGKVNPGSPAILIIATSALRSIELLRGVKSLTQKCHAAKLFSKHIKVDEQVSMLKRRVNIASGTPNRIKKLIEIEALGLSRLSVIVLDMHVDIKGYSLFTLPQVRDEFWDLYKTYFHQRLVQGDLRLCLYGALPTGREFEGKNAGYKDK